MKVAIIGMGVIGKAQARMFSDHEVVTYDPSVDGVYPEREIDSCDMALICVGTPEKKDGHADLTYVEAAAKQLPREVPAVLRSTVPPGTTDRVLGRRTTFYCHAPEFMGENVLHSWQNPADVPYMHLGGTPSATAYFHGHFGQVFPGIIHRCSARESELAKYVANLYWATRVTFVNEMALICEQFGVNYESVREAWLNDPRMSSPYTQREGYPPGFDGRCWPKDLAALITASEDAGYDPHFLNAIEEANARFRE